MKSSFLHSSALAVLACAAALFASSTANAQVTFAVSINTTALIGHSAGPFSLDFQLNNGGVAGNNTAVLSQFNFGGGSANGGTEFYLGGASGSLGSTVSLTDSSFLNDFSQEFTPGAFLNFRVTLSTNFNSPTPDTFSFAILDSNFANIPTFAPLTDALVTIDITGTHPFVSSYAGNPALSPSAGGLGIALPSANIIAVPEPSTYGLIGAASLVGFVVWSRRRALKNQLAA